MTYVLYSWAGCCPRPRRRPPMSGPKLTAWEKSQIVRLEIRGVRRAAADITDQPDIDLGIERIKERARKSAAKSK